MSDAPGVSIEGRAVMMKTNGNVPEGRVKDTELARFIEQIEVAAGAMDASGWNVGARSLRRWVSELRCRFPAKQKYSPFVAYEAEAGPS